MRAHLSVAALSVLLPVASLAAQQSALGRLEGTVREKVASRSVTAAWVSLVGVEPGASVTFNTRPDERGRYRIDSLPAGRYLVQVSSPTLDSLDLALPPDELKIAGGRTARADFSLPSGTRLRDAICHGLTLGPGKAVVAGRAIDADSEQPIAGADVVVLWTELAFDRATLRSATRQRATVVRTGPRGEYRLCGVPAGKWLSMQLQHAGRAGAITRLTVSEDEGAAVRDISLSARSGATIAALDSVDRLGGSAGPDSTRAELQLVGSSMLTGTVRGSAGQPLADVQVRVRDARSSAVTDSAGRFVLAGLPPGTQLLLVRHLGYGLTELPVELRPGRSVSHDVRLTRAAWLDSVHVVGTRSPYPDFERDRRSNPSGQFLSFEEIQRRNARETADLLRPLGGFSVTGRGAEVKVISREARLQQPQCKNANVVIEGVEDLQINDVLPSQIGGMAVYRNGALAPARFAGRADCGLIVIWLKSSRSTRRPAASGSGTGSGLRFDGYP